MPCYIDLASSEVEVNNGMAYSITSTSVAGRVAYGRSILRGKLRATIVKPLTGRVGLLVDHTRAPPF